MQEPQNHTTGSAVSGSTMDTVIDKKRPVWKAALPFFVVIGLAAVLAQQIFAEEKGKSLQIDANKLKVADVFAGTFEDYIPIRARVEPLKTVYLDAIEGGRVEKVLVEDGAMVEEGQPIVLLSNTQLQLSVMRNEAAVTEQLNNIRNIELSLEQNKLAHKRNLIEIDYQIKRLSRLVAKQKEIIKSGSVSSSDYQDNQDLLEYYQNRRAITLESQLTDARMQAQQLEFLKGTGERLETNLEFARQNIENLNMKAPVAGKLSGLNIEIGQSISRGERIGQIDEPSQFKLEANIDEFYLDRIEKGQFATVHHNGAKYELAISKIYPQVRNGRFSVDFQFTSEQPQAIRRGQSLQIKLTLGDTSETLLVNNGAFYQDTGGNWAFVLDDKGQLAKRQAIQLGRRNNQFIEVLSGLEQGDRIITSSYASYQDMQTLTIQTQ